MKLNLSSYSSTMHLAAIAIMFAGFAAALPGVKMETRLVEYYTTLAYYTTVPIYYADPTRTFTSAMSSLETRTFHVVYTERVLVTSSDEMSSDLTTSTYATPVVSAVSDYSVQSEIRKVDRSSGGSFASISHTAIESGLVSESSDYSDQFTETSSRVSAVAGSSVCASLTTCCYDSAETGMASSMSKEGGSVFDGPNTSAGSYSEAHLSVAEESAAGGAEVFSEPTEVPEMNQSANSTDEDVLVSHFTASESSHSERPTSWVSGVTVEPGKEVPEPSRGFSAWSSSTSSTNGVPSEFVWDLEDPEGAYQKTHDEFPMITETSPSYTTEDTIDERSSAAITDSGGTSANSVTSSSVSDEKLSMVSSSMDDSHDHQVGTIEEPGWESVPSSESIDTVEEKFAKLTAASWSTESEQSPESTNTNSGALVTSAGSSDPAESERMFTAEVSVSAEPTSSHYDFSEESGPSFSEGYDVTDDAMFRSTATSAKDFFTDATFDESSTSIVSLSSSLGEADHLSSYASMDFDLPEATSSFGNSSLTADLGSESTFFAHSVASIISDAIVSSHSSNMGDSAYSGATETGVSQKKSSLVSLNALMVSAASSTHSVLEESSSVTGHNSSACSTLMIETSLSEDAVVSSSHDAASKVIDDTKRELGPEPASTLVTTTAAEPSEMTASIMPLVSIPAEHVATHTSQGKFSCCQCPAEKATPVFSAAPSVQISDTAFLSPIAAKTEVTTGATQDTVAVPTGTGTTTFLTATSVSDPGREVTDTVQIETEKDLTTPAATTTAAPPLTTLLPIETETESLADAEVTETENLADAETTEPVPDDTMTSDSTVPLPKTSTDANKVPKCTKTSVRTLKGTSVTSEVAPVQSTSTTTPSLAPELPPYVPPENPFRGDATFFYPDVGACGWANSGSDLVAAVNKNLFDKYAQGSNSQQNPLCGMKVNAHYGERSVAVSVVDTLGAGNENDLGLSPAAFAQLADKRKKKIKVTWDLE